MQSLLTCKCSEKWADIAPLLLRVATGAIFFLHGYLKVGDVAGFSGFIGTLGVPAPEIIGPVVIWMEIIGGIVLALGLLTHWVAKILAIEMLVALFLVHWDKGFYVSNNGYEFALLLVVVLISLMVTGPGKWALDKMLFSRGM